MIKAAYDDIYADILRAKGSKPKIAIRAFKWVHACEVYLHPDQLVAACCQDSGHSEDQVTKEPYVDIHFILDACRNMLTVDPNLGVCVFSHFSVQEYLAEYHCSHDMANEMVFNVYLSLLNDPGNWKHQAADYIPSLLDFPQSWTHKATDSLSDIQHRQLSRLIHYARWVWADLAKRQLRSENPTRVTALRKFLESKEAPVSAYESWAQKHMEAVYRNVVGPLIALHDPNTVWCATYPEDFNIVSYSTLVVLYLVFDLQKARRSTILKLCCRSSVLSMDALAYCQNF